MSKKPTLTDVHREDLYRSGLDDSMIEAAGIYSLPPSGWEAIGAAPQKKGALSAYRIPYPGTNGFYRDRIFYATPEQEKEHGKYHQPAGSPCRLYFPPKLNKKVLADPTVPLFLVEGEKKTLAGVQAGLICIGVGGWSNVCLKGTRQLINDFNALALKGRDVVLVPDNDYYANNHVRAAVQRLRALLVARGC